MAEPLNPTPQQQSEILMQALPHMLRYDDAIVVVKYGGHAMGDEDKARDFAKDMVLLEQSGINPVVVHGGGPADRHDAEEARHRIAILRRPEGHRQADDGNRRNGAGRIDQQADRRLDQRRGRARGRPLRQGRQHGHRAQGPSPAWSRRRRRRSRLCRRARQGGRDRARADSRPRADPGAGARSPKAPTGRPTTSTPTLSPAPSPARSAPSASCS